MTDETSPSRHERRQARRYLAEALPALAVALAPIVFLTAYGAKGLPPFVPVTLAVVACVGALAYVVALVRFLRRADEYEQQRLRAMFSWAFGVSMLAAFALTVVNLAGVSVDGEALLILTAGMTGWLVAAVSRGRR